MFVANRNGMLYEASFQVEKNPFAGITEEGNSNQFSQNLWHSRLCHLNVNDMKKMITNEMVTGLEKLKMNTVEKFCEACVMGKQCRLPFSMKECIWLLPPYSQWRREWSILNIDVFHTLMFSGFLSNANTRLIVFEYDSWFFALDRHFI